MYWLGIRFNATQVDTTATGLISSGDVHVLRLGAIGISVVKHSSSGLLSCRSATTSHLDGTWHHVVAIATGIELALYRNGAEVCRSNSPVGLAYTRGNEFFRRAQRRGKRRSRRRWSGASTAGR